LRGTDRLDQIFFLLQLGLLSPPCCLCTSTGLPDQQPAVKKQQDGAASSKPCTLQKTFCAATQKQQAGSCCKFGCLAVNPLL
jgi:hypothetical protein